MGNEDDYVLALQVVELGLALVELVKLDELEQLRVDGRFHQDFLIRNDLVQSLQQLALVLLVLLSEVVFARDSALSLQKMHFILQQLLHILILLHQVLCVCVQGLQLRRRESEPLGQDLLREVYEHTHLPLQHDVKIVSDITYGVAQSGTKQKMRLVGCFTDESRCRGSESNR